MALLILWPQLPQTHSDNIWLLRNVNPIEKQPSFTTAPGLSYLADFVNNFLKDTLVPDEFTNAKPQNLKQYCFIPYPFIYPSCFKLFVGFLDICMLKHGCLKVRFSTFLASINVDASQQTKKKFPRNEEVCPMACPSF